MRALYNDGRVEECEDELKVLRHTAAHVLAQAVKRLFPETKLAIGPAIEDGFYYDFDREGGFSEEDLAAIEAEMKRIVKENLKVETYALTREEALEYLEGEGETYKAELVRDLPEDVAITFYRQGDFTDLCAGPHALYTKAVKAFKLTSLAGAYWRGSEDNKMLTRIYGTAFPSKEALDAHLAMLEEARKRDHRRLGRDLGLFALMDEGPGFPFFLPKGTVLKNNLLSYCRGILEREGYLEICTPIMLTQDLWLQSGHWDHYKDNMYTAEVDGQVFCVKPMNCPGGILVYKNEPHSYRELPIRIGEFGLVHRHERSGTLHGLMRVRCFTQDDAHIFMTRDQVTDEIKSLVRLIDEVYSKFGFKYKVELSTRPEDSMGSDQDWEDATEALRQALAAIGLDYAVNEGDGAFYGPKIDFHLEDSIGRTWQCGTIQLDFQMPQRFDISYIGADNGRHTPIMLHRVIFGSVERFIGILIEHYAGKFPTWLSPVQVKVLSVSEKSREYAGQVLGKLKAAGIRCEIDNRDEKIGYKIREAQLDKVPYMLVLGEKESESGDLVAVRSRDRGDMGTRTCDGFIAGLLGEISGRESA
ncbi:MAG: threonine--tRNA ligase [Candidatus Methanomethylophilaceae archaeon]|jgi:threonyl-tRNA synthetase|nr:threonine--tRNA ligase [Candidatus Methanomethylophilaceae archaeon]NLF33534.1 threonine--tRNA ligase [Thermoplasmatales archaeon]